MLLSNQYVSGRFAPRLIGDPVFLNVNEIHERGQKKEAAYEKKEMVVLFGRFRGDSRFPCVCAGGAGAKRHGCANRLGDQGRSEVSL